jgi:hypothetical protein
VCASSHAHTATGCVAGTVCNNVHAVLATCQTSFPTHHRVDTGKHKGPWSTRGDPVNEASHDRRPSPHPYPNPSRCGSQSGQHTQNMQHHMSAAGACWQQLHMSDCQHQQIPTYNPQHDCIGSHWIAGSTAKGVPCVGQPSLCTLAFSTGQPPKAREWQAPADSKANKKPWPAFTQSVARNINNITVASKRRTPHLTTSGCRQQVSHHDLLHTKPQKCEPWKHPPF